MFHPTLDVEVAEPPMFKPDKVVVPKPSDDTESCVPVDEPITKLTESPAIGFTDSFANGVVVPMPTLPALSILILSVGDVSETASLVPNTKAVVPIPPASTPIAPMYELGLVIAAEYPYVVK